MNLFGVDPHSVTPTTDPFLWARWLLAVGVTWWLPGALLLRGRLRGWPLAIATYARLATGFVGLVVMGLAMRWFGRGLDPLACLALALPLAYGLNLLLRRGPAGPAPPDAEDSGAWGWTFLACAGLLGAAMFGFRDLSAPPHVHDASNHAFMVARAAATGSLDPARIFAGLHPPRLYFSGWHFVAAITGQLAGVAPYVAAWFTAITCMALAPLAFSSLWWRWGSGAAIGIAAAFWVMSNSEVPAANPFSWGGFGVQVGFFVVPLGAIVLAACVRSRAPALALAAGVYLAATMHIHFSELVIVPLLALLTWKMQWGQPEGGPARSWWPALGLFVVGLSLAWVPAILDHATRYASDIGVIQGGVETVDLWRAMRGMRLGMGSPDVRFPWAIGGTILLVMDRRLRPVAIASLLLGFWIFALKFWYDPVSRTLAAPFYGQVTRIGYQQIYFMPLAAGVATVLLARWAAQRSRILAAVTLLVTAAAMSAGYANHQKKLAGLEHVVPFGRDEYALARQIGEVVGEGGVVANYRDDGSTWASHVSGASFLNPLSWPCTASDGTDLMEAARGLREVPWPAATRRLEERGVRWLYVSDRRLPDPALFAPADFAGDPRFTTVLERGGTSLLRIEWDRE